MTFLNLSIAAKAPCRQIRSHSQVSCVRTSAYLCCCCCLAAQSCPILCNPMDCSTPGPPCPSPSPVCPTSCSLHWWCCPVISSSDAFFSFCFQSFPASGTFPMSGLFTSDALASASILPVNIQGLSPLKLTRMISLLSKGLPGVFSSTTVHRHSLAFCLLYGPVLTTLRNHCEDHNLDCMDLCRSGNVSAFQCTV